MQDNINGELEYLKEKMKMKQAELEKTKVVIRL